MRQFSLGLLSCYQVLALHLLASGGGEMADHMQGIQFSHGLVTPVDSCHSVAIQSVWEQLQEYKYLQMLREYRVVRQAGQGPAYQTWGWETRTTCTGETPREYFAPGVYERGPGSISRPVYLTDCTGSTIATVGAVLCTRARQRISRLMTKILRIDTDY